MTYHWTLYFSLFLALWSAVIAGVFSAFSEFIMSALSRTKPAGAIEAMQHINVTVIKTQFVVGILSIALFSVLFSVYSLMVVEGTALVTILLATLVYLPSVFFTTIFGNVPMNNKLESLDHNTAEAEAYWAVYLRDWTRLNHARAFGSAITSGLYIIAAITLITSEQV